MIRSLIFCMLLTASTALAYVPPAAWILKQSIKDRSGLGSLEWTAKVTDLKTQTVFKEVLRADFRAGKLYIKYLTPADEAIGGYQIEFENLQSFGKVWFEALMDPDMGRVRAALTNLHVLPDVGTEAKLTRQGKLTAWSWGSGPMIHFLKDEFYVVGYQSTQEPKSDRLVFDAFASTGVQARVPRNARIQIGGVDTFSFELKSVKMAPTAKFTFIPAQSPSQAVREWVALVR
jgi:hypothetical protein